MSMRLSAYLEVMVDSATGTLIPECCGLCLTASDVGLWGRSIAYPHPLCPEHGDPHTVAVAERERLREKWAPNGERPVYDEADTVAVMREVDTFYDRFGDDA